jgi:hypothetical protein
LAFLKKNLFYAIVSYSKQEYFKLPPPQKKTKN